MKLWPTKKTPCPRHGGQGETSDGPDVRRRRQRGAPSAVESQCSSRQAPAAIPASRSGWALCSCGLFLSLVAGLVEGLSERFVVKDDARGYATHGPIADLLNGKAVVSGNLGGATHACDS